MASKAPHLERLKLLREHASMIQAGIDDAGEPFLFVEGSADMSDVQRKTLAFLMIEAASGLLEDALGGVVH